MMERNCTTVLVIGIIIITLIVITAVGGIAALDCCSAALLLIAGVCSSDDSTGPTNQPDSPACRRQVQLLSLVDDHLLATGSLPYSRTRINALCNPPIQVLHRLLEPLSSISLHGTVQHAFMSEQGKVLTACRRRYLVHQSV